MCKEQLAVTQETVLSPLFPLKKISMTTNVSTKIKLDTDFACNKLTHQHEALQLS